jgi:non-heme chloroperoxidase
VRPHRGTPRRQFAATLLTWLAGSLLPLAGVKPSHANVNTTSRWFTTSDGNRLHYLEAGVASPGQATLVFVPGWTMPAWIWSQQIDHFAPAHRVLAFDPRGQGRSALAASGYDYQRRALDIAELLQAARCDDVVLVGWSLGVLECLRYLHDSLAASLPVPIRGLVLVDNSVGEGDPPKGNSGFLPNLRRKRRETVSSFVKNMFKREQPQRWLDSLTEAALRTPTQASISLLSQGTPREFWRETLYALAVPVLYVYTPRFAQQGELVKTNKPSIDTLLFENAGHALFVDEAAAFNMALQDFVSRAPAVAKLNR